MELMKAEGLTDVLLTGGGIIPDSDMEELHELGVGRLFGPGASLMEINDYINNWVQENRK
jgi:methylmalonyl-CoA mutase C-terminal domain/subunit